jgi:hypothetical protein
MCDETKLAIGMGVINKRADRRDNPDFMTVSSYIVMILIIEREIKVVEANIRHFARFSKYFW